MEEIVDFLKQNKELFQKPIDKINWKKVYELALDKFAGYLGKFTEFWLNKGIYPENYLSELPEYFLSRRDITSFEIPHGVESIGDYAFSSCTSLTSVTIGNSVTSIGEYAFEDCGQNLVIEYNGTKDDWKEVYNSKAFTDTYFTCHCIDGDIVKKKG